MGTADPRVLLAAAAVLAIGGFLMLDQYQPQWGVIGNAMRGNIGFGRNGELPYRYVLMVALAFAGWAAYAWQAQRPKV